MKVPNNNELLVYVVAYNAEKHIESVLDQIPHHELNLSILVSDDASQDNTSEVVKKYQKNHPDKKIKLVTQKKNLGYGGNQKFGFKYSIDNGFYALILIHGDGQYSPKLIPQLLEPILDKASDAVIGSRMINKRQALQGGMPLYKFVGNIILTKIQNMILGTNLSEFHTGLRAYKIKSLVKLPFLHNSNGFSFDTDILIQFIDNKMNIAEIAIPTHYGEEVCNVVCSRYATEIFVSTAISRMQKFKMFSCKKFNYTQSNSTFVESDKF